MLHLCKDCFRQIFGLMKKHKIVTIIVIILIVLISANNSDGRLYRGQLITSGSDSEYPILASCSGKEEADLYDLLPEDLKGGPDSQKDTVDVWAECYHEIVGVIIEELMSEDFTNPDLQMEAEGILDKCLRTTDYSAGCEIDREEFEKSKGIDCRSESAEGLLKPSLTTARLACRLAPWENKKDLDDLSRVDTTTVLLEFLRTYECALMERGQFLTTGTREDLRTFGEIVNNILKVVSFNKEYKDQKEKIERELSISRPALHRAIRIVSGIGKMHTLEAEIECFQRVSLDLRNSFALSAETASCMPRVWDAQDSLRDIKDE